MNVKPRAAGRGADGCRSATVGLCRSTPRTRTGICTVMCIAIVVTVIATFTVFYELGERGT